MTETVYKIDGAWVPFTVNVVRDGRTRNQLVRDGVPRGHIWTFREWKALARAVGDEVKTLEDAARMFASEAPEEVEALA